MTPFSWTLTAPSSPATTPTPARCGGWTDVDLSGALAIFNHPEALLAHVAEPPFV